jgi:hypothetical protein
MVKLELEIDDIMSEYFIPESWDEVTVKQFCDLFSTSDEGLNDIQKVVRIVSVFTNIKVDELMMMSPDDFQMISKVITFITKELEGDNVESIEVDGEEYFLKSDFEKLTMGEILSIDTLLQQNENNLLKVMDKLLCIFLRKKNSKGNLESFRNEFMLRSEKFSTISITKVHNILSYFSNGGNLLPTNTRVSLENEK